MKTIEEPKKYNMYMSTKNQKTTDDVIRKVLCKFIRGDKASTGMQVDMINTGSNIIIGTYMKDISESKCAIINRYCIKHGYHIYCWIKKVGNE